MKGVMDAEVDVTPAKTIYFLDNASGYDGRVPPTIAILRVKFTPVALNANRVLSADLIENKIEPEGARSSPALVLLPDRYLVTCNLLELPKEYILDRAIAWLIRNA
jgi:hypothetical protein